LKSSVLLCVFCGQKDSLQRIFIKKCFLFTVGGVYRVKRFSLGGRCFADDEAVETEVRKWLRRQSKDFCAAGFDALVKRTNVSMLVEDMSGNKRFSQIRISHVLCYAHSALPATYPATYATPQSVRSRLMDTVVS
jgi:hypothetical protein